MAALPRSWRSNLARRVYMPAPRGMGKVDPYNASTTDNPTIVANYQCDLSDPCQLVALPSPQGLVYDTACRVGQPEWNALAARISPADLTKFGYAITCCRMPGGCPGGLPVPGVSKPVSTITGQQIDPGTGQVVPWGSKPPLSGPLPPTIAPSGTAIQSVIKAFPVWALAAGGLALAFMVFGGASHGR